MTEPLTTAPQRIVISRAEFDRLMAELDRKPVELPKLKALFATAEVVFDRITVESVNANLGREASAEEIEEIADELTNAWTDVTDELR